MIATRSLTVRIATALAFSVLMLAPASAATEVERIVSPLGIEAWLVRSPTAPLIAIDFAFRGGSSQDPTDKAGVASLVAGLIDAGQRHARVVCEPGVVVAHDGDPRRGCRGQVGQRSQHPERRFVGAGEDGGGHVAGLEQLPGRQVSRVLVEPALDHPDVLSQAGFAHQPLVGQPAHVIAVRRLRAGAVGRPVGHGGARTPVG